MTQVFHPIRQGLVHQQNVADQGVNFLMILVSWILENDQQISYKIVIGHTAQSMASVVSSSPLVDKSNRQETGNTSCNLHCIENAQHYNY